MRKDVLISICGIPDLEEPPVELITPGKLYRKNGVYSVIYRESSLTGLPGVTTTLKIESDRVTLQRRGAENACMIFRQGEKHYNLFEQDGEPVTVSISANQVRQRFDDSGGELDIDYSVEINDTHALRSRLHVNVRDRAMLN
ncbi:MAG: DUF1934 domain-containing protein [Clostridiaceae bacterium]|nr:DUF1934 domain-containing protein [Clostridiales bacterium]MDD6876186.1 DUF1934 domain-containing protein [Clostridiaceae bacterium]MDY3071247.1 DUF1934 domain-containing protein [Eubacteriales bacterium]MDY3287146.1 DUF1934 domain-containing protein [Eubacteriales bacterium]